MLTLSLAMSKKLLRTTLNIYTYIYCALLLLLLNSTAKANIDSILTTVICSGGFSNFNSDTYLSVTIGQPIYLGKSSSGINVSGGFQQPYTFSFTYVEEQKNEIWNVDVYPTLFSDYVNMEVTTNTPQKYTIEVFDILGNQVSISNIDHVFFSGNVKVDLGEIKNPGLYFLRMNDINHTFSKTIRLIKM